MEGLVLRLRLATISLALLPVLAGCAPVLDTLAEAGGFTEPSEASGEDSVQEPPATPAPAAPAEPVLPWSDLEPFDSGRSVSAELEDLLPAITEFSYGGDGWVLEPDDDDGLDEGLGPDIEGCLSSDVLLADDFESGFADLSVTQETADSFTLISAGVTRFSDSRIVRWGIEDRSGYTRAEEACLLRFLANAAGGTLVEYETETFQLVDDPRVSDTWIAEALVTDGEFEILLLVAEACSGVGDVIACVTLMEVGGWEGWLSTDADYLRPLLAMQTKMLDSLSLENDSPGA